MKYYIIINNKTCLGYIHKNDKKRKEKELNNNY